MEAIFIFLSFICLIYFIIIVLYSGITTSFCFIWLIFAALFGMMAYFCAYTGKHRGGLPRRLPVSVFTSFTLGIAVFVLLMIPVLRTAKTAPEQNLTYVVVLGTKVYPDSELSNSLKKRLDAAYEYHLENPDTIFVLSGGQGPDEPVPEALAMYNYLYRKGVPAENMRVEMFSESTAENVRYSLAQIETDKKQHYRSAYPDKMKIGILTSDYHLFRAMGIARHEGYTNVSPVAAPSDSILFLHLCVRECAAIVKDHIMGNLAFR